MAFNNTSAVDICSCVYLITYQALHSPTFRPHAPFKTGIEEYNRIKNGVKSTTNDLFLKWQGEGKNQFEKDYNTIYQQLSDIGDIMYELYDALIDAQAAYIQADEEAAKLLTIQ